MGCGPSIAVIGGVAIACCGSDMRRGAIPEQTRVHGHAGKRGGGGALGADGRAERPIAHHTSGACAVGENRADAHGEDGARLQNGSYRCGDQNRSAGHGERGRDGMDPGLLDAVKKERQLLQQSCPTLSVPQHQGHSRDKISAQDAAFLQDYFASTCSMRQHSIKELCYAELSQDEFLPDSHAIHKSVSGEHPAYAHHHHHHNHREGGSTKHIRHGEIPAHCFPEECSKTRHRRPRQNTREFILGHLETHKDLDFMKGHAGTKGRRTQMAAADTSAHEMPHVVTSTTERAGLSFRQSALICVTVPPVR